MYHIPQTPGKVYGIQETPGASGLPAIKAEEVNYFGALL